jgi:LysM repeat protein
MFARLCVLTIVAVSLWALFAHDSGASGPEQRYRVRPGDTLWSIAAAHFAGDPRKGVWQLQERNGLDGTLIVPGQVLTLPA